MTGRITASLPSMLSMIQNNHANTGCSVIRYAKHLLACALSDGPLMHSTSLLGIQLAEAKSENTSSQLYVHVLILEILQSRAHAWDVVKCRMRSSHDRVSGRYSGSYVTVAIECHQATMQA